MKANKRIKPRETEFQEFRIGAKRRAVFVLDGVIEPDARPGVYRFMLALPYRFLYSARADTQHVKHFIHFFPREELTSNPMLKGLSDVARNFLRERGERTFGIDRAYANLHLYGDQQFRHIDGNEWTALTFLNEQWREEWDGELLFFDDRRDTALAVVPKPGRMVIFDGLLQHRGGVPSKLCLEPRISLGIRLTRPKVKG